MIVFQSMLEMKTPVGEEMEQKNTLESCHTVARKLSTKVLFSSQQVCWKCASCVKFKESHDGCGGRCSWWCQRKQQIAAGFPQAVWLRVQSAVSAIQKHQTSESADIVEPLLCTRHYMRFQGHHVE